MLSLENNGKSKAILSSLDTSGEQVEKKSKITKLFSNVIK
jgi:hypothetical protein